MNTNNTQPNIGINERLIATKTHVISTWNKRIKILNDTKSRPSITIPDLNLSIRQILDRFTRGQSLPKTREPQYDEENDFSEFTTMSRLEKLDAAQQIRNSITEFQNTPQTPPSSQGEGVVQPQETEQ